MNDRKTSHPDHENGDSLQVTGSPAPDTAALVKCAELKTLLAQTSEFLKEVRGLETALMIDDPLSLDPEIFTGLATESMMTSLDDLFRRGHDLLGQLDGFIDNFLPPALEPADPTSGPVFDQRLAVSMTLTLGAALDRIMGMRTLFWDDRWRVSWMLPRTAFVDMTDFNHEIGLARVHVFPSVASIQRANKSCIEECGIGKVSIRLVREVIPGVSDPTDGAT